MAIDAVRSVAPITIPDGVGAGLLLEVDGEEGKALEELIRIAELATEHGAVDSAVAQSGKDREEMRRTRQLVSPSLKEKFPFKNSDDIAVPRSRMAELLERALEEGERSGVPVSAYGHLGDGNLHVNLLSTSEEERRKGETVRRRILALAVGMGGTVSGEHGIGLAKRDVLGLELADEVIAMQKRLKSVFDPKGIMNPGKVWPA